MTPIDVEPRRNKKRSTPSSEVEKEENITCNVSVPLDAKRANGADGDGANARPPDSSLLASRQEAPNANADIDVPPPYGSQEYWERRYRQQHEGINPSGKDVDGNAAWHEWYFTYDDLRPIILPLVLNGRPELAEFLENLKEDSDDDGDSEGPTDSAENGVEPKSKNAYANKDGTVDAPHDKAAELATSRESIDIVRDDDHSISDEPPDDHHEGETDSDSNDEEAKEDGIAKSKSIAVLEIGCGDAPLATCFAAEMENLENMTGSSTRKIIQNVVCVDCSPSVVETMKKKFSSPIDDSGTSGSVGCKVNRSRDATNIPMSFKVMDVTAMSFAGGSFDLVLEKGTLDAMRSDQESGLSKCLQTISECARVTAIGGCIIVISHMNAHTYNGMEWLSSVLVEGLKLGAECHGLECSWSVEVHGNQEEDDANTAESPSAGPAVYVIRKGELLPGKVSKIKIKLVSY
jgi:ubiquinone/menaquinone biosynthesis C-methylase UbiE